MQSGTKRALLGAGLALAALASGCGGKAAESPEFEPPYITPTALPPPRGGARPPRRTPGPPVPMPPQASPPELAPEMPPMVMNVPQGPIYIGDTAEASASNVLIANCAQCHGPTAPEKNSGGIRFIGDIEQLVAAGLIVPLSSATSRIVTAMVDGSMPPPSSGLPPVTEADINTVTSFIDNPRFWPGVSPPAPPPAVLDAGVPQPLPPLPPAPPPPPAVVDAGVVDVPVDIGTELPPVDGAVDAGAVAD